MNDRSAAALQRDLEAIIQDLATVMGVSHHAAARAVLIALTDRKATIMARKIARMRPDEVPDGRR